MKRIAVIGGGISGLSVLHYLKQKYADTHEIVLYEAESRVGGTIQSFRRGANLFELGPNGFLDNQPTTLDLIKELGLTDQLIASDLRAQRRYIQIKNQLYLLPSDPIKLIQSPLLSFKDKGRLVAGLFKKNISTDQSIDAYVSQRFGQGTAQRLVDPFISGIYAGDTKRLHMASAFPRIGHKGGKKNSKMYSFKLGMEQIVENLHKQYQSFIKINLPISAENLPQADLLILATPAYRTSQMIHKINPNLAKTLDQICYVPVAVVGLTVHQQAFKIIPDGFGYLIPSSEKKNILGVLIESNVYQGRSSANQLTLRVMLGGAHHPEIIHQEPQQILTQAIQEITAVYGLKSQPMDSFIKIWPKAIPQYELNYPSLRQAIRENLKQTPHIHLSANYLDGISFNDCIYNAYSLVNKISL